MPRTRAKADIPGGSIRPSVVLPAESVIRLSPPQYRYSAYGTTMTANRIVARPSLKVSFISHLLLPQVPASVLDRPGPEVTPRRGLWIPGRMRDCSARSGGYLIFAAE